MSIAPNQEGRNVDLDRVNLVISLIKLNIVTFHGILGMESHEMYLLWKSKNTNNIIPLFYVVNINQLCHINSVLCSSPKDVIVWENFLEKLIVGGPFIIKGSAPWEVYFYSIQVNSKGKPLQPLLGAEPKMEIPGKQKSSVLYKPKIYLRKVSVFINPVLQIHLLLTSLRKPLS